MNDPVESILSAKKEFKLAEESLALKDYKSLKDYLEMVKSHVEEAIYRTNRMIISKELE